jgi:hypothetical protein
MTAGFDRAGAVLTQALRDFPDPPCDLRAARLELRRRTRRVTVWRRLALGVVFMAAAVVALALLQGLPGQDNSLPPVKQLPSGLPDRDTDRPAPHPAPHTRRESVPPLPAVGRPPRRHRNL